MGNTTAFYNIPTATGGTFLEVCDPGVLFNYGGVYDEASNTFTGVTAVISSGAYQAGYLYKFDMTTLQVQQAVEIPFENVGMLAIAMAKDPATGRNYGYFYADGGQEICWGYVDYDNVTRTAITTVDSYCSSIAVTSTGEYYGLASGGQLKKIDMNTGALTDIGAATYPSHYSPAVCMNPDDTSILVYAPADDAASSALYEVNLQDASTTLVASYPVSQMQSLYVIPSTVPRDKAPMEPALTVEAPEGTLTVSYTITLPTSLIDGTPVTGVLDWEILVDNESMFEGRNMAGTSVSGELTLNKTGEVEFAAVCKNADGSSPRTTVRLYVGKDLPAAPANVKAVWADGKMTLTWDAVTGSENGGYVNPAEITYRVLDLKHYIILAQNLAQTTYEFDLPMPETRTAYQYAVLAMYDGKAGEMTETEEMFMGAYPAPYDVNFLTGTNLFGPLGFTVLDANEDGKTWTSGTSGAQYTYSTKNAGDDWLFSPALRLEGGKVYKFTIVASGNSSARTEEMEVMFGSECTAEAMTGTVLPRTSIKCVKTKPVTLTGQIAPEATGNYHIGLHAVSAKNMSNIYVQSFSVGVGQNPGTPSAATDFTLSAEKTGELVMTASVTAPAVNILGNALEGDVSLKIFRNSEELPVVTAAPGATVSFTDRPTEKGMYTYTVTAFNADGESETISKEIYVGPYPAKAPAKATMFETYQPGTVTIVWDAVTQDVYGTPLDPSTISYMVYDLTADSRVGEPMLPANVTGTTATFQALADPSKQDMKQYVVHAFNRGEESTSHCLTNFITIGEPYKMPLTLSNHQDVENYVFGVNKSLNLVKVQLFDDGDIPDVTSQDGDGTVIAVQMTKKNQWGEFYTGKIDLTTTERPELVFCTYRLDATDNNPVKVSVMYNGLETEIYNSDRSEETPSAWNKIRLNLSEYKGKNVQLKFRGTCTKYNYVIFDNITVRETPDKDLSVSGIIAPVNVKAGKAFDISVLVTNNGYETASTFTVNLSRNGQQIESRQIASLDADEQLQVVFENLISLFDEDVDRTVYSAEVVFDGDKNLADNKSDEIVVERTASNLPAVTDLAGEQTDEGVRLTWTPYVAPEVPVPATVVEDVEGGVCGEQALQDWTILDVDGKGVGTFQGLVIPGLTDREPASFFVFDVEALGIAENPTVTPASGSKFMGSFPNYDYEENDDWMISPVLTGDAQTISFYAKSYDKWLPTNFQILYTTSDSCDPADFTMLAEYKEISDTWTKYEAELPEGTLRFAIRHYSLWACLLMVDDITLTYARPVVRYNLLGHDIYRNGVKLNGQPVIGGEYLDNEVADGNHAYHVVTRYDEGDSELSNKAEIAFSGIGAVSAAEGVSVAAKDGCIVVSGAGNNVVTIAAVDGKVLYSAKGDARVAVAPAVYIVTVADRTFKLLVK